MRPITRRLAQVLIVVSFAGLVTGAGNLKKTQDWWYTNVMLTDGSSLCMATSPYYGAGSYYSRGQTQAWTGSGYTTYTAPISPYQTVY